MRAISIRQTNSSDLKSCIALLADAGLPTADVTPERLAFAAESEGRLLGAIGLEQFGSRGLLRSLVVAGDNRHSGIGERLVAALESLASERDIRELWLLTIDANRYFEKLGYQPMERSMAPAAIAATEEFASLCPGDAWLMMKAL